MTAAFGTVKTNAETGAHVTVVRPSGHELTTGADDAPIYAAEDLTAGQRVIWATWLVGNWVTGENTDRELPDVNARLRDAEKKLDGDRLERILDQLLIERPIGILVDRQPGSAVMVADFIEHAVRAIQADT